MVISSLMGRWRASAQRTQGRVAATAMGGKGESRNGALWGSSGHHWAAREGSTLGSTETGAGTTPAQAGFQAHQFTRPLVPPPT